MSEVETRELRYFVAVAEELHFGRAAARLGMAQPPLSRAIRLLEHRLGVKLLDRDRRRTALTDAGRVLLAEGRAALDAVDTAVRRTRRSADPRRQVLLATEAGASLRLLQRLLDPTSTVGKPPVDVLVCETGEQAGMLCSGRVDVALMHRPFDDLAGLRTEDLCTEGQVAIVPATHPLAARGELTMAEVHGLPDLVVARWPNPDGSDGNGLRRTGPTRSQLAQLVALGQALVVVPASSRAWQWPEHASVPVTDAPEVTAVLAWTPSGSSPLVSAFTRSARDALRDLVPTTSSTP